MPITTIPTKEEVSSLQEQYEGKRIECVRMAKDPRPIAPGEQGTCLFVDGLGQLVMKWDSGRSLSLLPEVDNFKIIK